jgi:tetratricopeptide (TPR) repeat protein
VFGYSAVGYFEPFIICALILCGLLPIVFSAASQPHASQGRSHTDVLTFRSVVANWLAPWYRLPGVLWGMRWLCGDAIAATSIFWHGDRLYEREKFDRALHALDAAIALDPSQPAYWSNRGACHYELRNYRATIDDTTQALLRDPWSIASRQFRAMALLATEETRGALEDLKQIPCRESADSIWATWRGTCHEKLGQWAAAADDYKLALRLDPESEIAMCTLARIYSGCPLDEFRDGAKAIELAKKACDRREFKDWETISVLASSYAEAGDFATALIYARQTLELAPAGEKSERAQRIEQFEQGIAYRLPIPATLAE